MIAVAQGQKSESSATQLEFASVIQLLEQAQRNAKPQVSYQVIRQYQLSESNSSHVSSKVVAEVEYFPPDRESYVIQRRSGSSRGEDVVRRILDHESALVAAGPETWSATLLTRDNYTFTNLGESTLDGKKFLSARLNAKAQAEGVDRWPSVGRQKYFLDSTDRGGNGEEPVLVAEESPCAA